MNYRQIMMWMAFLAVTMVVQDAEARGGGRGGGGGGRGGGGRSISRAPTMSRSNFGDRSNFGERSNYQRNQARDFSPQQRSSAQVQQFVNQNRSNVQARNLVGSASNLRGDYANRQNIANNVRRDWNNGNWNHNNLFNDGFWNDHHYAPVYGRWGNNFWRGAAWGAAAGWLGYGWSEPYYYDGGYSYPVTSSGDTSYIYSQEDQAPAPAPVASQPQDPSTANWLPLGNYVVKTDPNSSADSTMYLQLALNKDGTLAGTYFNSATNQVQPMSGLVDKATQKAVWKATNVDGAPIFDTGLYNLTKDNTPVNVTFSDGSQQTWLLVKGTNG